MPGSAGAQYTSYECPADSACPGLYAELAEKVRRRALGAVLGSAVADAAAMGVQGVLDLSMLNALAAERGADEEVCSWML